MKNYEAFVYSEGKYGSEIKIIMKMLKKMNTDDANSYLYKIETSLQKGKGDYMTVYVLTVDNEVVGVYDEYTKAYDVGCSKYDGDFDIDEFEVEQKCVSLWIRKVGIKMVYVTWNDTEDEEPNVISFTTWEEAEEFCKENGLKTEECCAVMNW